MNYQELQQMTPDELTKFMADEVEELEILLSKDNNPENPRRKEIFEDLKNFVSILSGKK